MYYYRLKSNTTSSVKLWRVILPTTALPRHLLLCAQTAVWLMQWDVHDVSLSFRSRTPGRQQQSSHYHMGWPSWIYAHTLAFPLIARNTSLCSCRRQPLHLHSGFHVSSTQGLCSHRNSPPTLQHPFLILHTFLHTKISNSLSLTLVPFHLQLGFLLFVIALPQSHLCMLSAFPHLTFYLQPTHTLASQSLH